ncbi:MAG: hypothetical protein ACLU9S_09200 [Oscillospiraceae bacterium]
MRGRGHRRHQGAGRGASLRQRLFHHPRSNRGGDLYGGWPWPPGGDDAWCAASSRKHLESITAKLVEMGAEVEEYDDAVRVRRDGRSSDCNVEDHAASRIPYRYAAADRAHC